jgi:hypothetical protein
MYPALIEAGLANFHDCKTSYNIDNISLGKARCSSEKDCEFGGFSSKCNRVTNRCIPTQKLELETTRCMLRKMSHYTEHFFEEVLSLPDHNEEDIEDFLKVLVPAVSRNQCRNDLGDQTSLIDTKEFLVINKQCNSARQVVSKG